MGTTPAACQRFAGWVVAVQICSKTHSAQARRTDPIRVRVIDTRSMTDANTRHLPPVHHHPRSRQAGAIRLAPLTYRCRWEIESPSDELKTINVARVPCCRSKSPDLVLQGDLGHLCCHFAIRSLMADTAAHTGPTHNA